MEAIVFLPFQNRKSYFLPFKLCCISSENQPTQQNTKLLQMKMQDPNSCECEEIPYCTKGENHG